MEEQHQSSQEDMNNENRTYPQSKGWSIYRSVFGIENFALKGGVLNREIFNKKERRKKILKGIFLVLLFVFLLYKTVDYFGAIGYRETWTICMDYMRQGTLWEGQPHCEGAILPFYILLLLDSIFGREYVQIATIVFSTIVSGFFFWIFFKVVKQELQERDFFWPLLFFGLFFYINNVTNIESVLNSFFFFMGYYFLFYREEKWKYLATGFLLLCALLSKINVVLQIAFLLFWYGYEKKVWYIENKKIKLSLKKEVFLGYCLIATPIIVGFTLLTIFYKYFWIYSWSVFTNQTIALSFLQTIKEMILINMDKVGGLYFLLMGTSLLGIWLFWKEKKFYVLISGPAFAISMFLIVRAFGINFVTAMRYWSVILPFLILTLLRIKQLWTTTPKRQIVQGMFILLLLYPGFYTGPFQFKDDLSYLDPMNFIDRMTNGWQEKDALVKQIHYGYSIVPEQEGRILAEHDPATFKRMLISFGSNIPYEQIDFLTRKYMESHPDVWGFPRYQELLGEDMIYNPTSSELNEKEKEIIEKIENGTYSLIIYGPPEWAISQKIISNLNNETLQGYCQIAVPNNVWLTEDGWHFSYFFFRNAAHCQVMIEKMYTYFSQNYQEICTKDMSTANMITTVLRQDGLPFDKACIVGGDALEFLKQNKATKKTEFLAMILFISLPFFWIFAKEKLKQRELLTKKQRLLCLIILSLYFITFIMLLFLFDATIPYKEGVVEILST